LLSGEIAWMTDSANLPWSRHGDHVSLSVRLTPKAARNEIVGIAQLSGGRPVLQIRVRAVPSEGAANEALIVLLAKTLGLPKQAVQLVSGATGRVKCLRLSGKADALELELARAARL
jgi:uncharacterized protein (TIGR00251 family)